MTCTCCASRIEKKLSRLDGIAASAELAAERARAGTPEALDPERLTAPVIAWAGRPFHRAAWTDLAEKERLEAAGRGDGLLERPRRRRQPAAATVPQHRRMSRRRVEV